MTAHLKRIFASLLLIVTLAGCDMFDSADKDYAVFHKDIAGGWTSLEDGARLTLFPTGQFKLQLPDGPDMLVRGNYTLAESEITFDGIPDNYRAIDFDGTYALEREGDLLYFTPVSTPTEQNAYVLAETWREATPMDR